MFRVTSAVIPRRIHRRTHPLISHSRAVSYTPRKSKNVLDNHDKHRLVWRATCAPGLTSFLHQELQHLGIIAISNADHDKGKQTKSRKKVQGNRKHKSKERDLGHVDFEATVSEIHHCLLHLGTARHVLLLCPISPEPTKTNEKQRNESADKKSLPQEKLKSYDLYTLHTRGFDELRRKVSKMALWSQLLPEWAPLLENVDNHQNEVCKRQDHNHQLSNSVSSPSPSASSYSTMLQRIQRNTQHTPSPLLRLTVSSTSYKSKLQHTGAISQRVIWGIEEALLRGNDTHTQLEQQLRRLRKSQQTQPQAHGLEPRSNPPKPEVSWDPNYNLHIKVQTHHDKVQILAHAHPQGHALHRRGYRLALAKAPLAEDLARALCLAAGLMLPQPLLPCTNGDWEGEVNKRMKKKNRILVVDPFCGSGTIAIEAALLLKGRGNPSLVDTMARAMDAPLAGTALFEQHATELESNNSRTTTSNRDNDDEKNEFLILASDRNAGAVVSAKSNAARAKVDNCIQFQCCSVSDAMKQVQNLPLQQQQQDKDNNQPFFDKVFVITNPPHGKRISPQGLIKHQKPKQKKKRIASREQPWLLPLYQTLGHQVRELKDILVKQGRGASVALTMLVHNVALAHQTEVAMQDNDNGHKNKDVDGTSLSKIKIAFATNHGGMRVSGLVFQDDREPQM